jgi:hypothetical protein
MESPINFKLKPGGSCVEEIDLNLLYDLTVAGKYFISAKRKVMEPTGKWSPTEAESNRLEITIDDSLLPHTTGEFAAHPYTMRVPRFADFDGHTPDLVYASIRTYEEMVADLIRQARTVRNASGKSMLFYMLGNLHTTAAIPTLLSNIDFDVAGLGKRGDDLRAYPAAEELIRIGSAVVDPIVAALGEEKDETRRKLMVGVLRHVLGADTAEVVLQNALHSSRGDVKQRLELAKGLLKVGR